MSRPPNNGILQRRLYLPRGLRGRLAQEFGVSVSVIDWRIRHNEALEAARLKASTLQAALLMVLSDTKNHPEKTGHERKRYQEERHEH